MDKSIDEVWLVKEWLDKLFYQIGKQQYDYFLQFSEVNGVKTKWRKYSEICFDYENPKNKLFLSIVNQRQILPCEVVLDIENKEQLPIIISELNKIGLTFYVFSTGSRGYHVHLFFNRALSQAEKIAIIKYFKTDIQKASNKTLIALEFAKHWKSGKIKELVKYGN
ncbi:MAG: hypothetical protein WC796_03595 [Candidatus Pacearchaeota archaeon]|jgi:hypothetical protein